MHLCPSLVEEFKRRYPDEKDYLETFGTPYRVIYDPGFAWNFDEIWRVPGRSVDWHDFYSAGFEHAVQFDGWAWRMKKTRIPRT